MVIMTSTNMNMANTMATTNMVTKKKETKRMTTTMVTTNGNMVLRKGEKASGEPSAEIGMLKRSEILILRPQNFHFHSQVYLAGDKVTHGGLYYQARWWNSASQPNPNAKDDVWEPLGASCDGDGVQIEAVVAEEDSDEEEEDAEHETEVDSHIPEDHEGPPTVQMAEAREAQLTNTPLFRLVKASIETLKSSKVDKVKAGRKANPENVKRVESILSAKDWEYIFPMRDSAYSYARFLQAVAKFPSLCGTYTDGRDSNQICRLDKRQRLDHEIEEKN